jgi:hypothetical protein
MTTLTDLPKFGPPPARHPQGSCGNAGCCWLFEDEPERAA